MQSYPQLNPKQNLAQEGVKGIKYPEILSNHFCWALVGIPGSGKTTFIEQLIDSSDLYKGLFDFIFVISPSRIKIMDIDDQCITN